METSTRNDNVLALWISVQYYGSVDRMVTNEITTMYMLQGKHAGWSGNLLYTSECVYLV